MEHRKRIEVLARGLARIGESVLVCRSLKQGHSFLPGGHVEFGESSEAALARELQEEAGLLVTFKGLATVVEQRFVQGGRERHEVNLVFHVELPRKQAGELPKVESLEPAIAFEWMHVTRLPFEGFKPAALIEPIQSGRLLPWYTVDARM